jgi:phage tail protein X
MIAVAQDGEKLDALVWRELGRTAVLTERTFAANPGLAQLGPALPGGTRVDLTEVAQIAIAAPQQREIVSLWD